MDNLRIILEEGIIIEADEKKVIIQWRELTLKIKKINEQMVAICGYNFARYRK